jgi:hypothetical protein
VSPQADSALAAFPAPGHRLRRPVWILLFVLGLFLWIPVVLRAKLGASASTQTPSAAVPSPTPAMEASAAAPAVSLPAACEPAPALTGRLVLTTTIVGKTRRAAIVNGRLYREGDKIVAGNERYRLAAVANDRIDLVGVGRSAGTKRQVHLDWSHESKVDQSAHH